VTGFLLRRVLWALLLAFVVASGGLVLARLAGGDFVSQALGIGARHETVEQLRAAEGLNRPFLEQYVSWLEGLFRLDFGRSLLYQRPVGPLVMSRIVNSAFLAVGALLLACCVGLPLGVFSGSGSTGILRQVVRIVSIVCLSVPPLISSLLLVWMAAVTGWFPIGGMSSLSSADASAPFRVGDLLWHLPVPVFALGLPLVATLERVQSQAIADALAQPCMVAAFARGASRRRVLWSHALRLSAKTPVAIGGLLAGVVLSGSFAVELVTAWPGLGRLTYEALLARDVALVAGCATAGALLVSLGLLASDILLALVDRRTIDRTDDAKAPALGLIGR
jgi:peptide/nickel transport system permease protein